MEKQKYKRIKILGILVLVFLIVPLITVSASAASGSGARGYGGHGGNGNGGYCGWGPAFGYYPLLPMAIVGIARSSADLMDVTGMRLQHTFQRLS
jgi:nitrate reductase NapE component